MSTLHTQVLAKIFSLHWNILTLRLEVSVTWCKLYLTVVKKHYIIALSFSHYFCSTSSELT